MRFVPGPDQPHGLAESHCVIDGDQAPGLDLWARVGLGDDADPGAEHHGRNNSFGGPRLGSRQIAHGLACARQRILDHISGARAALAQNHRHRGEPAGD